AFGAPPVAGKARSSPLLRAFGAPPVAGKARSSPMLRAFGAPPVAGKARSSPMLRAFGAPPVAGKARSSDEDADALRIEPVEAADRFHAAVADSGAGECGQGAPPCPRTSP